MENFLNLSDFYEEDVELSEKYTYHFDFPCLQESGYVEIQKNKLVILFPEKNTSHEKEAYIYHQNILFFINNQVKFSFQWLPIYSIQDLYRIRDMFFQSATEFQKMIQQSFDEHWVPDGQQSSRYYSEVVFRYKTKYFSIKCFENSLNSTIELSLPKHCDQPITNRIPKIFQIFIGNNLVFCSERDLSNLNLNHKYFIILFLLQKCIKL